MGRKPIQFETHPISYRASQVHKVFRAWGEEIVDGDTLDALLDLGFYQYAYERLRLEGIDTPEIFGVSRDSEEYERGMEAKALVQRLALEQPILVRSLEEETFGRFVARVWVRPAKEYPGAVGATGDQLLIANEERWISLSYILREEGYADD